MHDWTKTDPQSPKPIQQYVSVLQKVRALLQGQIEKDRIALADLYEKKARSEHGGGQ